MRWHSPFFSALGTPRWLRTRRASVVAGLLAGILATQANAAPDPRASRFYEDALLRYERHDVAGAILQLKNALQIDRSLLPVQVLLGKALLANGEAVAAEVALLEAMRLGVDRAEVAVPLAQAFVAQGKPKRILDDPALNPAGTPASVQVQLWLLRAAALADLRDPQAALKAIEEARVLDPRSAAVWLAEVPVRIRARQWREALAAADRALALQPDSAEAWYQKGSVLHVEGDLRGAMAAYDRALAALPAHVEARVARAGLALDLGRGADAARDVAELQRLAPGEPRAAYLKALIVERDDPAAARRALADVTALLDPVPLDFIRFRPQLLMLGGLAHFSLGEREKAKPYLEALQRAHGPGPATKLLARIYLSDANPNRAGEVLEAYLKTQPKDAQALTLLGGVYMAQGRNAKAAAAMQEALRGQDSADLRAVLGLSLIGAGQAQGAVRELQAAFDKDPRQTQAGAALVGLYLRGGAPRQALAVAEALVRQQPANAGAFNLLGVARARSGQAPAAREAFEQALKLDRGFVAASLGLARLDAAAGAFDAAAARLQALLKVDEHNVDVLLEMAGLAQRQARPADTQRWLEKANDHAGPRELRPGLALVDLHLRDKRPAPALEVAKSLFAKAPDDVSVLLCYARAQLAGGAAVPVRATLTNATRMAEFNAPVQVEIARLQLAAANPGGAAYSLEKALSAQPDFLPAMALMSEVELRQGDLVQAERRARRIVEIHPHRALGHALLAEVARARGDTAAALESLRRAHQQEPGSATFVPLFRALSTQDAGRPAVQLAEQWLKAHPQDAAVRAALGDAHARAGRFAAARAEYEAVLRATPDDAAVLNNLANVLVRQKDPGAIKLAEQALARRPGEANLIDTLGWALFQAGEVERALPFLRDARLRDPQSGDIRLHLATALARTGRPTEAREELDAARRAGGNPEQRAAIDGLANILR